MNVLLGRYGRCHFRTVTAAALIDKWLRCFCKKPLLIGILIPTNERFGPLPIFDKVRQGLTTMNWSEYNYARR